MILEELFYALKRELLTNEACFPHQPSYSYFSDLLEDEGNSYNHTASHFNNLKIFLLKDNLITNDQEINLMETKIILNSEVTHQKAKQLFHQAYDKFVNDHPLQTKLKFKIGIDATSLVRTNNKPTMEFVYASFIMENFQKTFGNDKIDFELTSDDIYDMYFANLQMFHETNPNLQGKSLQMYLKDITYKKISFVDFLEIKENDPIGDLSILFGINIASDLQLEINFSIENIVLPENFYENGNYFDFILEENISYDGINSTTKKWIGIIEQLDILLKEKILKNTNQELKNKMCLIILEKLEKELYSNMSFVPVTHVKASDNN